MTNVAILLRGLSEYKIVLRLSRAKLRYNVSVQNCRLPASPSQTFVFQLSRAKHRLTTLRCKTLSAVHNFSIQLSCAKLRLPTFPCKTSSSNFPVQNFALQLCIGQLFASHSLRARPAAQDEPAVVCACCCH